MEKTSNRRSPTVTGTDSPVTLPVLMVPMLIRPVKFGVKLIRELAIGLKIFPFELYSCAFIVTVLPIRLTAAVVLKNAVTAVSVPVRGTDSAKLLNVPAGFVKSMVAPKTERPWTELPNPTKAGRPANPDIRLVNATGRPEA